jgi:hypothetical protein
MYCTLLIPIVGTAILLPLAILVIRKLFVLNWSNPLAFSFPVFAVGLAIGILISYLSIFIFPSRIGISEKGIYLKYLTRKQDMFEWRAVEKIEHRQRMGLVDVFILTTMGKRKGIDTMSKRLLRELVDTHKKHQVR